MSVDGVRTQATESGEAAVQEGKGRGAAVTRRSRTIPIVLGGLAVLLLLAGAIYLIAERDTTSEVASGSSQKQVEGTAVATAPVQTPSPPQPSSSVSPQQTDSLVPPSTGMPAQQTPSASPPSSAQDLTSRPRDQTQGGPGAADSGQPPTLSQPSMNQEPAALPNPGVMFVQARRANIRSAPARTARVVGTATKGNQVKVVGQSGNWLEVETGGRSGWISGKLLGPRSQEQR